MSVGLEHNSDVASPTPLELAAFVPYACRLLGAPFNVRVLVTTQEEYVSKIDTPKKKSKTSSRQHSAPETVKVEESVNPTPCLYGDENVVVTVTALIDGSGRLVEIDFRSEPEVPCLLIKIIGLCLPFHQSLNKVTVRRCGLDGASLYQFSKYLNASRLTELCLDDSQVTARNYALLLEGPSNLKHLSLARCNLVSEDCIAICDTLVYPRPASATLQLLNLASNAIDDAGARALGEMLRSNRTLQYINLSGNRITDVGAGDLLKSLVRFKLTDEELHDKRVRTMTHSKLRREVYEQCLQTVIRENVFGRSKLLKKGVARGAKTSSNAAARYSLDAAASRAEAMVEERLGTFAEPFAPDETSPAARSLHSVGNRSLCYLNLCYNDLGYWSVTELVEVLIHQSSGTSKFGSGLMRVLVEGNPLPILFEDYEQLDELLENLYKSKNSKQSKQDRGGKSRLQLTKSK